MAGYINIFAIMILKCPIVLALLGVVVTSAQVTFPGVDQYGVGKRKGYTQTGPTQGTFTDFTFEAFIDFKIGADVTLNSATLQGPLLGGTQTLSIGSSGANFTSVEFTGEPTNAKGNLNNKFEDSSPGNGNKTYDLSFEITDGETTSAYTVNFPLSGDAYPLDVPTVTLNNGSWLNGVFQLDSTQSTSFGWAFSNYSSSTDVIIFNVKQANGNSVVEQQFQGSNPGGYTILANVFTPGVQYIGELTFARLVANDTTSVSGAQGVAFYALETTFNFQAVPEPSTYILLGLGSVLLFMRRQRRA